MSKDFFVPAVSANNFFTNIVSKGDAETYSFDFSAWEEENHSISSVTWTVESGQAAVSNQSLIDGVASALVTFSEGGRSLVSITATTATEKKKVWLELKARNHVGYVDDYGLNE